MDGQEITDEGRKLVVYDSEPNLGARSTSLDTVRDQSTSSSEKSLSNLQDSQSCEEIEEQETAADEPDTKKSKTSCDLPPRQRKNADPDLLKVQENFIKETPAPDTEGERRPSLFYLNSSSDESESEESGQECEIQIESKEEELFQDLSPDDGILNDALETENVFEPESDDRPVTDPNLLIEHEDDKIETNFKPPCDIPDSKATPEEEGKSNFKSWKSCTGLASKTFNSIFQEAFLNLRLL